ncbi:MAG: tRNA (adenosine(37)-N6)-dimethylallyltransferase MiaA [Lachnospiraceae bacterium]|nr:tRNA (adenosine(37)-N6)-dimethylallyltransferase MiaA [Lachnospiraceae bacterium]
MPPLIILTGPTAVGKTSLSVKLAKEIGGEIISADSMQVYRHMDIGTAKIAKEEMDGIPHHLIDILEPTESFNVMLFQEKCKQAIQEIYRRGNIPILVGGTGFYIQSVLYDISFTETETDTAYRQELQQIADKEGAYVLHAKLAKIDPEAAEEIHPNNVKRVIRALEYYHQTGRQISTHNAMERQKESPYRFRYYVLSLPREELYSRINLRVDAMREAGLVEEVKKLLDMGCTPDMVSMQGLGYKEVIQALAGESTMEEAFERIKRETRHFAKRQFTWFRRERDVIWLEKERFSDENELLEYCLSDLQLKLKN